jgi:anti-sigma-K factor RskA
MHMSPEDLALLALGEDAGGPDDRAHLAQCPVCMAELDELRRVVVVARQSDPDDGLSQPSPVVWQNIRAEIAAIEPGSLSDAGSPSTKPAAQPVSAQPTTGRRRLALALAAALVLIVGIGVGFGAGRLSQPDQVAAPSVHLNAMPTWPGSEGKAEVTKDAQGNQVLNVSVSLAEPANGRMEVWLSDDKSLHMQSMGFLENNSGSFNLPPGMDLSQSPVIDVSMEPPNDTNPAHSGVSVVRGRLVR